MLKFLLLFLSQGGLFTQGKNENHAIWFITESDFWVSGRVIISEAVFGVDALAYGLQIFAV